MYIHLDHHERRDAIDLLYDAQEHLDSAIESIAEFVRMTGDTHTKAYIFDHLRIMAHADHGYLSNDANLDDVIQNRMQESADADEMEQEHDDPAPAAFSRSAILQSFASHNRNEP